MAKAHDALTDAQIDDMDAVATMEFVMRNYLRSENFAGAVSVARDLAPYQKPKVASTTPNTPLPEDMEPDPPAQPDEAGPERPIVGYFVG